MNRDEIHLASFPFGGSAGMKLRRGPSSDRSRRKRARSPGGLYFIGGSLRALAHR
jgi:hypothetical protein